MWSACDIDNKSGDGLYMVGDVMVMVLRLKMVTKVLQSRVLGTGQGFGETRGLDFGYICTIYELRLFGARNLD